ncbi:ABC transporter ATP-binding protein [Microbacterium sp. Marseille-Q6965]|uniref:ABC transporter ATP-binding protein n=1 Tax=Microbacterium sp. Marseille-Q6965 TaxID=2965072 RepID=UPI0021B84DE8|nr:ABC transporter ATP-binding protein [Microbacterium sp. Marseille-Q6965]
MSRLDLTRWLIGHTRRLLAPLAVSVVARIANQLLGVALLALAATAVVRAAEGRPFDPLPLVLWLVGIALTKALLRYLEHYAGHAVAFTALQRLRELLFARLIPQAPAATQGRAGAELTAGATRDIDRVEVFFAHTLPPAVSAVAVPTIALVWLASAADARLALASTPFVLATLLVPLAAGAITWRSARGVAAARGALAARLGDDIQGVREVLALGAAPTRLRQLDAADRSLGEARSAAGRVQAGRGAVIVLLQGLGIIAVVGVGAAAGTPTEPVAVALAVAVALWGPARGVDEFAASLDASFAAAERVRRIIDGEPAVRAPEAPGPAPADASVDLRDATVSYGGMPALHAVSARFPAGEWSVVAGVSGSGKSTLASLLPRGRDVQDGAVLLGGADVRDLALDELRRRVALVAQRPTLLSGTIAENLRLAAPDATDERLREALADAALDEWIDALPAGLDTPVSERGASISGGQLQRLALARALVADPEVLVLDEALSQLDGPTAARVRERLRTRRAGLTVIEITHRVDLVPDDTRVLVLDVGRVVDAGRAGELRAAGGPFARLEARA